MLTKKQNFLSRAAPEAGVVLASNSVSTAANSVLAATMDRRTFLKRFWSCSGRWCNCHTTAVQHDRFGEAANVSKDKTGVEVKRTVILNCSVGCAVDAVVENGVWVRQEPASIHRSIWWSLCKRCRITRAWPR